MSNCVFLVQQDGKLVEMIEQQYTSEDILQQLIAKYPNILAGENGAVTGDRKWLLITREAAIASKRGGQWPLVPFGSSITLHAVPDPGFFFVQWSGDRSETNRRLRINDVRTALALTAVFAPLPNQTHSVSALASGRGSVEMTPLLNAIPEGTTINLAATPQEGQRFLGWSGDASGEENPLEIVVHQSMRLTAHFSHDIELRLTKALGTEHALAFTIAPTDTEFLIDLKEFGSLEVV